MTWREAADIGRRPGDPDENRPLNLATASHVWHRRAMAKTFDMVVIGNGNVRLRIKEGAHEVAATELSPDETLALCEELRICAREGKDILKKLAEDAAKEKDAAEKREATRVAAAEKEAAAVKERQAIARAKQRASEPPKPKRCQHGFLMADSWDSSKECLPSHPVDEFHPSAAEKAADAAVAAGALADPTAVTTPGVPPPTGT